MSGSETTGLRLVVLGDEDVWAALPERETLVIGSAADRVGLHVTGQGVDDVHCAVGKTKGGGWAIKDLGSEYGTIVNGERIQSVRLWTGDVIVLGSRRLRVVDPELPIVAEPAPAKAPDAKSPAPRVSRERLGGFRLDRLLGRGGMGSVHLALQESLNRPVALKILSPKLAADRDFVGRFQSEARAAAALSHPNIVVVYDVGEAEGRHYLAMEFMVGGTLEERVAESGPLPWRRVLDVLRDAAAGLVYAEELGIVHRDIKPANLMLTATDTVKIADLGLATTVETEATRSEGRKIFGTPHFISPEQARGEPVDHRSDLYSLGASAYRLLTGHTPFEGETTRDILRGHFTLEPAPLGEHVPGIPDSLNRLVLRLLEKAPADRFASAGQLLAEVDRLRAGADGTEPVIAAPAPRRFPVGAVVAGLLVVIASVVAWQVLAGGDEEPVDNGDPDPAVPVEPDPVTPDPDFYEGPGDEDPDEGSDERRLRILDLEAQIAYRDIPASLSTTKRIEALDALQVQYAGTETALKAAEEILSLRADLARAELEAARMAELLATVDDALRNAAAWPPREGELPHPARALSSIRAYVPPAEIADRPELHQRRDALVADIVATSRHRLREELDRGDPLAGAGDFAALRILLADLAARLALPSYEPGTEPPGLEALGLLSTEVQARRARIDADERAWNAGRLDADRRRLAQGLGRPSPLGDELARLALEEASTRLLGLASGLATLPARTQAEELANELLLGHEALMMLAEEFEAGGWRRRTISYPRGHREVTRDAIGATSDGILVAVDGENELVPWSAFGGRVEWIEKLYKGRLERDYTAEEQGGILVLLRIAATLETIRLADQVLSPDGRSIFQPSEAEAMVKLNDRVLAWIEDAPDEVLAAQAARIDGCRREREAAEILGRALLASQEGTWSSEDGELENHFVEYPTTHTVQQHSDGSGWEEPPPEPEAGPGEGGGDAPPLVGPETPDGD